MTSSVRAQCRVCNQFAPADQFRMHHAHQRMVCPNCYSNANKPQQPASPFKQEKKEEMKPAGWDHEDEYLERLAKARKKEAQGTFSEIPGSSKVKYSCSSCSYSFRYDPAMKSPSSCPYCGKAVTRYWQ